MIDVGIVVVIIAMTGLGLFAGIILGYELAMDTPRAPTQEG